MIPSLSALSSKEIVEKNDERYIFQNYGMNLVNTLCFVGANSSWEEV